MLDRRILAIAAALLASGACSDLGPDDERGEVAIAFRASATGQAAAASSSGQDGSLRIEGVNGTLRLDRVLLLVGEFELEGADEACPEGGAEGEEPDDFEDCEDFEAAPFLLDLPLDGAAVTVITEGVAAGTYSELEFEIEDLDIDEDADDEDGINALFTSVRATFPDWPEDASLLVEGAFTSNDGETRTFRVFAEAEVEVEVSFDEPLVVTEDSQAELTVVLDPGRWFLGATGAVMDLSLFDFTGEDDDLLELEVEIEDGFVKIEVDD